MPLYDFKCNQCNHEFEAWKDHDDDNPGCPECKGQTERLIGTPAVIFKGSGFYETDYKNK